MTNEQVQFKKLTPVLDYNLEIYEKGLDFVFDNNDIKNLAITGPYGSGKTSLIETYKSKRTKKKFIHISLAHFKSDHQENNESIDEKVLEGKILNQLLHQIKPNKIPKTNFKVKQKTSKWKVFFSTILLLVSLILFLYIIFVDSWKSYVVEFSEGSIGNYLAFSTTNEFLLISIIAMVVFSGISLYAIFMVQSNRNMFKKLNLQGNEIEIFEESSESYFDKYLNEVLYIFRNSDADAIVFEDIDRYNVSQIFEKLREINTLINNLKEEPTRFIFLIKDDVFISKDRTKFFDFILPVVPVIDGSNSYDKFLEYFGDEDVKNKLDTKFLQGISLYIDDLRILKNIYNEFLIYRNRLNDIELNFNKLLALITYKNIFPRDFSELQLSTGFVYTLFNEKRNFIHNEIKALEEKVAEKESMISQISKEEVNNIDELDAIYFNTPDHIESIGGKAANTFITRVEFIRALKENPTNINARQIYGNPYRLNVSDDFKKLEDLPGYVQRRNIISKKSETEIESLKVEIREIEKEKEIKTYSKLQNIINKSNIEGVFRTIYVNEIGKENKFEEIKSSPYFPLIKYLIRNGYIDETYSDYMTYFYPNSLGVSDKNFLRSIADQNGKDYSYQLTDPQLILDRLNFSDFEHDEVLNFDLLNSLLNSGPSNSNFLNIFIKQLEKTKNFKFVEGFLEKRTNIEKFTRNLHSSWPLFFIQAIATSNYSEQLKKLIALDIIYYSNEREIEVINSNNSDYLTVNISNHADFLSIEDPDINKLISAFTLIGVCFKEINFTTAHKNLLREVYENNLYKLSYELITGFLIEIYNVTNNDQLRHSNYSLIMSNKDESLFDYVIKNIQEYLMVVIANCNEEIQDNEEAALELLNNIDIEFETKLQYLDFLKTSIEKIEKTEDKKLWPSIVSNHIAAYNSHNILTYYFDSGNYLDGNLIQFINSSNLELVMDMNSIDTAFGENAASQFFDAIVQCNELSNDHYKRILDTLNWCYQIFEFTDINSEKAKILIDIDIIEMNEENLAFIRENYNDILIYFIERNIQNYVDITSEDNYINEEVLTLLECPINTDFKMNLLSKTPLLISIRDKNYDNTLKFYILEHHFCIDDMQYLLDNHTDHNDTLKEKVKELILENIEHVIEKEQVFTFEFLKEFFGTKEPSLLQRKQLLVSNINNLDSAQVKEVLTILGFTDYLKLFDRGRPTIPKTSVDEKILSVFKSKKWITKYETDSSDSNFYRVQGRNIV